MAIVGATYVNLADLAKMSKADGTPVDYIVNTLSQSNPIITDIPWQECNYETAKHVSTHWTSLPSGTWTGPYDFVTPGKATAAQVFDTPAMLEAYSEVDTRILDLSRDRAKTLMLQSTAFIEGLGQDFADTLFNGDTKTNPKQFDGLATRYNTLGTTGYGAQIIDAGGTSTDNASIWFVTFGEPYVSGIIPIGGGTGLQTNDLGIQVKENSSGGLYQVQRTHFKWNCGLAVGDIRSVVRICNIDVSDLKTAGDGTDTSPNLFKFLTLAYNKMKNPSIMPPLGKQVIYMNNTLITYLDVMAQKKVIYNMGYQNIDGQPILTYRGIPIRQVDKLGVAEARIT
jgi:hypothetical protein